MTIDELQTRLEKTLAEALQHEGSLTWNPRSGEVIVIGFNLEDVIKLRRSTPIRFNPVPIRDRR